MEHTAFSVLAVRSWPRSLPIQLSRTPSFLLQYPCKNVEQEHKSFLMKLSVNCSALQTSELYI